MPTASYRWNPREAAAQSRAKWMQQTKRETDAKLAVEDKERRERVRAANEKRKVEAAEARERHAESVKKGFTVTTGDYKGWRKLSDYEVRSQRGELTPEERAEEAAATILEVEARKAEDQNWVTGFTPQQEHEIAGLETAAQKVKSKVISGDFGLKEGGMMIQEINQRLGSIQKIRRPRRKDEPWYPEGRKPGDIFTEGLTTYVVEQDGTPKLIVRPDQTPEYQQMKTQQVWEEKQRQAEEKRALEVEKYMRDLRTEQIEVKTTDSKGDEHIEKRYRTNAEVYEATLRGYPELAPPMQAPPPVFGGEPEQVTQAREALKTGWGMGLKARGEAKKIISAWEKAQGDNKKLTAAEIRKLPPGTSYIAPDGTRRRTQ